MEIPEDARIQIEKAWSAHDIPAAGAEPDRGNRDKCRWVEVGRSRPVASQYLHRGEDQIGGLGVARRVEGGTGGSDAERRATHAAQNRVDGPATRDGRGHASIRPFAAAAKR